MKNNVDQFFTADAAEFARRYVDYLSGVLKAIDYDAVATFVNLLVEARNRGSVVYFIGNGGSASTASHFANDLAIGTLAREKPFRVVSLTDNQAVITAVANDFGYEEVFSQQIQVLGKPGDVLVAISASGNSPNLLRAMHSASQQAITTVAITAFDGGQMRVQTDHGVHIPTEAGEYGPAEDAHLILNHLVGNYLMRLVRSELNGP
jgi:D-sedoheptulose 7-phosphate isomerase